MRARTSTAILSLSAIIAAPAPAADSPPAQLIPYGAMHMSTISHWQHYLPPIDEWAAWIEKDIASMKQVGMNSIALHVDWYDIEVAPGQYDFTRLDRLIDIVERHGLKALLWPWPELQPDWVPARVPGSEWLAADGLRPGPSCWDHPRVRAMIERFIRTTVARYKNRPCLLAWDVGAEAGIWVTSAGPIDQPATPRLYCYCPHTVERYRDWLKGKYTSLARLNETWASYYTEWSQIQPVRTGIFERAQPVWLDWRQFMLANTADFQRLKAETARQADPNHPITAHVGGYGWAYVHACTDEYAIARHFDIFGLSFFPFWLERSFGRYDAFMGGMQLDGTRSASGGKPMWVEELQGGPSVYGMDYRSRFPSPGDIRLWVWQSIAHGATGIFYWNWRPETTGIEAGGFGLVNYDGSLTDRAQEAGRLGRELGNHARRLIASRPVPAQIAILHDPRTFLLAHGDRDGGIYSASLRAIYRALFTANLPVDFLVPEQLPTEILNRYAIIYLPFNYVLSSDDARHLARYVDNGGTLFASLFCGLKDERSFVYETVPGAGLHEVLHVRQVQVDPVGVPPLKITQADEAIPSLPVGSELPVYRWQERLELVGDARVLATFHDGQPAIVAGRYGEGKTLYAGTLLPLAYDHKNDANIRKLLLDAAAWAGVESPVSIRREPPEADLEARVLQDGQGGRLLVLLNHAWSPTTGTIVMKNARNASNLLTGQAVPVNQSPAGPAFPFNLPARDVLVLSVE